MKPKPYNTEEQPLPVAAEPIAVYGHPASHVDGVVSTLKTVSSPGRMTVDEYFDELWALYLKKRENLQS